MSETPQRLVSLRWIVPIAVVLALASACGDGGGGPGDSTATPAATGSLHVLGSPEAPVELIEYADFQ